MTRRAIAIEQCLSSATSRSETVPPGYSIDPNARPMLRFQASLPHLPVPSLSSTAKKYLETVRPHVSDAAYAETESAVNEFVASPQAAELQKRLEARAADPSTSNWLADWWNDVAYMGYRDPVVVFVSYFYIHIDDRARRNPAQRAASLIKSMLAFREMTESQQLEPEKVKGAPLCMASYKWLFHSCRYPTKPSDTARKFNPSQHNHVVFVRKNKFYVVPLTNASGHDLSAAELEVQIERIIEQAGSTPSPVPIGALTSDNRDIWTDARNALLSASPSGVNAKSLETIESAMIVVCLDDTKPVTREDISWACWVGDGKNRFYDKHQLIVFDNGRSGFLGEHSCMDGTPTLRMNEFVLASLALNKVDLGPPRSNVTAVDLPTPVELKFETNEQVEKLVKESEARFDELVDRHDLHVLHYEGYGKNQIKRFKASPDAWAQLVKQLAFHKMFGRPGVTYESAQTRKYQLGRTEVIRSASNESKAWAEAMLDPKETDARRASLFRAAVKRHMAYSAWAADGQGVDRHLFGLKKIMKEGEELPRLYKDPSYAQTSHWELSTSQLSSPYFDGWGYGEVVPDGYGLSYAIGDEYIRWTITSLKRNTAELKHYLAEAATETRAMMERAAAAEAAQKGPESKL
ncbi:acyltransferase ChoActase/COT/CPT [Dendrothele bispora CBS 962.96]|uniref:Carnitine O-acetyltransferase, mitochondrial n=1 Tax=Dendrothele bispora (strain CBS 962.96) TaxID=1314807 RepID=A0A4S8MM14_DENBC|nr:acyltransferase ChoActase/COT/CPT [Dendrothele bispora CBS 962.96]